MNKLNKQILTSGDRIKAKKDTRDKIVGRAQELCTPSTHKLCKCIGDTDECSGCGLSIWRCTACMKHFQKKDQVMCIGGEHHLCAECYAEWLLNGEI